ncbi:MAG TPA: phage Gp37/Gp68 family protein [Acetobacteraceae bacterium]|nr:phage Gp37/Gp68 family protein [Acetobacteraceae bacterium]
MAETTGIEWTDATWNPVRGCTRVSEGCRGCYAETLTARFSGPGLWGHGFAERTASGPRWTGKVELIPERLAVPLHWKGPRRIFVNSTSDLFHESLPDAAIDQVFSVMAQCPQHTFQALTKRAARMANYLRDPTRGDKIYERLAEMASEREEFALVPLPWPLPNLWLGVSCEDQEAADERIPHLLRVPARVRFLSCEPLLGAIELGQWQEEGFYLNYLRGLLGGPSDTSIPRIDWVIAGGESGTHARPMHPDWARSLRGQCAAACVPFFFKQWGAWKDGSDFARDAVAVLHDGRVVEPSRDAMLSADRDAPVRGATMMRRVGKKRAGAMLDGREHREMPA